MTYGGPEFIKMIQKNNKITYIYFTCVGGGGKINQPGQLAPGDEDNQGGGQDKLLHRPYTYSHTQYKLDNIVYCLNSPDLFLSVFGTKTIIYNNGSIDILDTF